MPLKRNRELRIRDLAIRHLISPYGLAMTSLLLFLVAWLFPPSVYSAFLAEPDFIFLDPASVVFFLLCTLAFILGLLLVDYLFPAAGPVPLKREVRIPSILFILLPLFIGTLFCLYATYVLLRDNRQIVSLLLAMQASELKEGGMEISGPISQATPILMGIVWWALVRKSELQLSRGQRRVVGFSVAFAFVTLLLSTTLMVARSEQMPVIAGVAVIVLATRLKNGKLTPSFALKSIVGLLVFTVVLFVGVSVLRGLNSFDSAVSNILGYSIASYNRLAAILSGQLRYPFAGDGIYISAFVSFNRTFNGIFHLNQYLNWPDFDTAWYSEFGAVSAAGLDGSLIWSGNFGYIYSDLGWFSPLLLFAYGLITGWAWRQMKLGTVGGVVLYPWCAFCVLFWFGTNFLLDPKFFDLLALIVFLAIYELALTTHCAKKLLE